MIFTKFTVLKEKMLTGSKTAKNGGFGDEILNMTMGCDYHNKRDVGQRILHQGPPSGSKEV
jgi:hypothetical protein